MAIVNYVARRSVQGSHVVGQSYSLIIPAREIQRTSTTQGVESISLSGYTQNTIDRRDIIVDVSTIQLAYDTQVNTDMLEFLESVDEKERFAIDLEDTPNSAASSVTCILVSNYRRRRMQQVDEFTFSFRLRLLP